MKKCVSTGSGRPVEKWFLRGAFLGRSDQRRQCEECNMSGEKTKVVIASEREKLQELLNDFSFTCGRGLLQD